MRIELDKKWETFNELINTEEQNMKTPEITVQTMTGIVIETVNNSPETEHIRITPLSEIMLKIEEIPPLDIFYSLQHKAVVKDKERNKNWIMCSHLKQSS